MDLEIFEGVQLILAVRHQRMAGLVCILLAHVRLVLLIAGRSAVRFPLVLRAFLASGRAPLPFFLLLAFLVDPLLLDRQQIVHLTVRGHERLGHAPVESAHRIVFGAKGQKPLPGANRDMDGGRNIVLSMAT